MSAAKNEARPGLDGGKVGFPMQFRHLYGKKSNLDSLVSSCCSPPRPRIIHAGIQALINVRIDHTRIFLRDFPPYDRQHYLSNSMRVNNRSRQIRISIPVARCLTIRKVDDELANSRMQTRWVYMCTMWTGSNLRTAIPQLITLSKEYNTDTRNKLSSKCDPMYK